VSPEKQALAVFWSHKQFLLLEALVCAAWTSLALSWFWLPDSHVWGVALAAVEGLVLIVAGLWLMAMTLLFYRKAHSGQDVRLWPICQEGLHRIPALLAWALVFTLALWLSLRLKAPVWIWFIPAILLIPPAAQLAAGGFRGLARMTWSARYFPDAAILAAAGAYLPYKLIGWHPQLHGLALQTTSLAVRFASAYLLAVIAWLMLASLLGRLAMGLDSDRSV
jgi:hypothetical protein